MTERLFSYISKYRHMCAEPRLSGLQKRLTAELNVVD